MWIYIPSTSCRSAPGSEDSISESDWRFQALEQSAWLRGKPLPARSWHRRWTKDRCIQRLSGRMPEPSTVERGLAEFMASLPVIPASPSPSQASDEEPKTRDTSGPRSSASLGKWDPSSCSWRMSQAMFDWASIECSVILPKSGSTRSGQLFERPMSELRTDESGCSSWPTAVAGDAKSCGAAAYSTASGRHSGTTLTDASRQWPTPRTITGGAEKLKEQGINGNGAGTPLTVACKQMHGRQDQKQTGAESPSTSGLRLNPRFVEWLMGFPDEWTVCEHSATPSSQHKQPSPSENSHGGSDE